MESEGIDSNMNNQSSLYVSFSMIVLIVLTNCLAYSEGCSHGALNDTNYNSAFEERYEAGKDATKEKYSHFKDFRIEAYLKTLDSFDDKAKALSNYMLGLVVGMSVEDIATANAISSNYAWLLGEYISLDLGSEIKQADLDEFKYSPELIRLKEFLKTVLDNKDLKSSDVTSAAKTALSVLPNSVNTYNDSHRLQCLREKWEKERF
ncbi:MAG: hypothetical protein MJY64_01825 [archaeon]|nr:hypothetical protein [archaeon]